ncbi:SDR family NAD(P)-dependent oxidoreductase [Streptomyces enissocaesilis]|uniref:PKS/mFAS DH domain-containing protein n=1 Tax=Streptomyces enissocaesilis TaxID=332589 RepID=A0ABP6J4F4_9ACTN
MTDDGGHAAPHELTRLVLTPRPQQSPGFALPGLSRRVLVTDDGRGIAAEVVAALVARGVRAETMCAGLPFDDVPPDTGCLILLDALRGPRRPAEASPQLHGELLRRLGLLTRSPAAVDSVVLVHDGGGDFGLSGRQGGGAWLNGATALARTADREWPDITVKAVDLQCAGRPITEVGQALSQELLLGGDEKEVALAADGERYMREFVPAPPVPADRATAVDSRSFLVVTGGARGIAADCLAALATGRSPRLLLLGRTGLVSENSRLAALDDEPSLIRALLEYDKAAGTSRPLPQVRAAAARLLASREIRATLQRLERAGATVRYRTVDVRDSDAVRVCLREARGEWGPVTGLVHAAGVIADKAVAEKTPEQFDQVFTTKVAGLRNLLDATADDPLKTVCLFSSVSAVVGNAGQSDYAMANAVMDHLAPHLAREHPDAHVVSMAWGAWRGGMVGPQLQEHFTDRGVALIPVQEGARAFAAELAAGSGPARLVLVPDEQQVRCWGEKSPAHESGPDQGKLTATLLTHGTLQPELADHAIMGRVIVPVATAVEWMARAVVPPGDAGGSFVLSDIKVQSKLAFDNYPGAEWLSVQRSPAPDGTCALRLGRPGSHPQFSAVGSVGTLAPPAAPQETPEPLEAYTPPNRRFRYGGTSRFHGPMHQVLQEVVHCDPAGAQGIVHGLREMGWDAAEPWRTDPALVDGAVQLAVVWGEEVTGRPNLPMAVDRYEMHRPGPAPGPVTCRVTARRADRMRAICDAVLLDADGGLRAALGGIQLIIRPR